MVKLFYGAPQGLIGFGSYEELRVKGFCKLTLQYSGLNVQGLRFM